MNHDPFLLLFGFDVDFSIAGVDRVYRIVDQVYQDLFQLNRIGHNQQFAIDSLGVDANVAVLELRVDDIQRALHDL